MPIESFMASSEFQHLNHADLILSVLSSLGVKQVIDIAMIGEEDFHEISMSDSVIASFRVVWQRARQYKDGWASLAAKRTAQAASDSQVFSSSRSNDHQSKHEHTPMSLRACQKKRVKQTVHRSLASFTKRCILGHGRARVRCLSSARVRMKIDSLQSKGLAEMQKAFERVRDVFCVFASASPRFTLLGTAVQNEAESMQAEVYRRNSVSPKVVARRARMVESFFFDMASLSFQVDLSSSGGIVGAQSYVVGNQNGRRSGSGNA